MAGVNRATTTPCFVISISLAGGDRSPQVEIGDRDRGAQAREPKRVTPAHAAGAPGNQGDLASERWAHPPIAALQARSTCCWACASPGGEIGVEQFFV